MKTYLQLLFNKTNGRITILLLLLAVLFTVAALVVGVNDNMPAIVVLFIGIMLLVTAFVHIWKRIKSYLMLALIAAIGIPVFVVLHNVFYGLGELAAGNLWLAGIAGFFDVFSFLIATLVCPSCVVVGLLGALILFIRVRKMESELH